MKRDIPIGKAFRFPCLVERIVMRNAAVDGEKDLFAVSGLPKTHIITQPAFNAAALVIIGAGAFLRELIAAFKTVHIEFAHIVPNAFKVFDQLAVGHTFVSFHRALARRKFFDLTIKLLRFFMKNTTKIYDFSGVLVGVGRLELPASCSQSRRATNCATPRYAVLARMSACQRGGYGAYTRNPS